MKRPYNEDALLSYEEVVATCPETLVHPVVLVPTQEHLVIERMLALFTGASAEGEDHCVHVVLFRGVYYIHNGHHRWMIDLIKGVRTRVRMQEATS